MTSRIPAAISLALIVWTGCTAFSYAEAPGVDSESISFAQSSCFTGVCGETGRQFRAGIRAAFHERNLLGGVGGRQLALMSQDDAYDATTAAANAAAFAADDGVFAVVGGLGTPTARRMAPVLQSAGVPFVGILSGASFLHDRVRFPNVVNLRTGYATETEKLVSDLYHRRGARRFGIVYQEDAFGRSVLNSYHEALEDLGLPILAKASYTWHTHSIHGTLFTLEKADLDVVMLAATTSNSGDAIDFAREFGHEFVFGLLSIVNLGLLEEKLGQRFGPAVITRVLPDVRDESIPLTGRFRSAFTAYRNSVPEDADRTADESSLEGYVLGRFVISVLERMPGEPDRKGFLEAALESGPFILDGWEIAFAEGGNVGSDYVRLVEFAEGAERAMEVAQ